MNKFSATGTVGHSTFSKDEMSWHSSSSSGIVEDFSDCSSNVSQALRPQFYNKHHRQHHQQSQEHKPKKVLQPPPFKSPPPAKTSRKQQPSLTTLITITSQNQNGEVHRISQPSLPYDPRKWSREEVREWLMWMSLRHKVPIDPARFQMNGKALCLMSLQMFAFRVPIGGKLLYKDFQLRLTSAFHRELYETKS